MASNFVELLKRRTREGLNTNIIIIGAPRSGKSYAMLRVAEAVDEKFNIKNIAWTIPQFVSVLENPEVEDNSVVCFDEIGVSAKARRWYSEQNNKLIDVLQTYGFRHLTCIVTTPDLSFVDSNARKLFHYLIETTKKHDFREGWIRAKVRAVKYDPKTGKVYYPALVFEGKKKVFTKVKVPSKLIRDKYNEVSELWKTNLQSEINRSFVKEEIEEYSNEQIAEDIATKTEDFVKEYRGKKLVNKELIRERYGVTDSRARLIKEDVEKKLI